MRWHQKILLIAVTIGTFFAGGIGLYATTKKPPVQKPIAMEPLEVIVRHEWEPVPIEMQPDADEIEKAYSLLQRLPFCGLNWDNHTGKPYNNKWCNGQIYTGVSLRHANDPDSLFPTIYD